MKTHELLIIALITISVSIACAGCGRRVSRTSAQRTAESEDIVVSDTPVALRQSRRIRIYLGPAIQQEPAFTIVAGRVYRGDRLDDPFLTLEGKQVYSGGVDGPLLYHFDNGQVIEGRADGPAQFVQRDHQIYFGPDPRAPVLFSFEGTHVYRGDTSNGRVLARSNTAFNDPDLVKLVAIVLYMETLE